MTRYPPADQTWIFDIGPAQIEHRYEGDTMLHYRILTGRFAGQAESLVLAVHPAGDESFLASWQEGNKTTVVHWENFATGQFRSFVTMPDMSFVQFAGRMWQAG